MKFNYIGEGRFLFASTSSNENQEKGICEELSSYNLSGKTALILPSLATVDRFRVEFQIIETLKITSRMVIPNK